jgi:hypothetical protein
VVAYLSKTNEATILLYDLSDSPQARGFTQELVASYKLPYEVTYFRIATGNFVEAGEGITPGVDDIAVLSINKAKDSFQVEILTFNHQTRQLSRVALSGLVGLEDPFSGTLEIASGDFDGDGQAELAVMASSSQRDQSGCVRGKDTGLKCVSTT